MLCVRCTWKSSRIFSDNGTCFHELNNEMVKMEKINQDCAETVSISTTAWKIIPPGTPHMGDARELMVRSVKKTMRTLNDGRRLTDEILITTLSEAADMINTRPPTYLPQDSRGTEELTPNHLLQGTVSGVDLTMARRPMDPPKALPNILTPTME